MIDGNMIIKKLKTSGNANNNAFFKSGPNLSKIERNEGIKLNFHL